jgi:hypothetical protein
MSRARLLAERNILLYPAAPTSTILKEVTAIYIREKVVLRKVLQVVIICGTMHPVSP